VSWGRTLATPTSRDGVTVFKFSGNHPPVFADVTKSLEADN
jgi:hypothetical protein